MMPVINQLWPAGSADTRMHDRPARPTAFCWNQKYPSVCGEKRRASMVANCIDRITPAYAGKRRRFGVIGTTGQDHPRVCGEKIAYTGIHRVVLGSPPRMRGKVALLGEGQVKLGITPAYAGKSPWSFHWSVRPEDHPRVCGEKFPNIHVPVCRSGSSPYMRGKDCGVADMVLPVRITPAYAGKSTGYNPGHCRPTDHPRVCGEKMSTDGQRVPISGSPPRMRGKVKRQQATAPPGQDHPRVCGEKAYSKVIAGSEWGSPPHIRGKVVALAMPKKSHWITPAYAGKEKASSTISMG